MLWQVASGELEVLDQIEDPHAYQRHLTTVYGLDGRTWPSCMYTAIPQGTFAPDEEYLLLIIEAARIADFPEAYVESLRTTVWG